MICNGVKQLNSLDFTLLHLTEILKGSMNSKIMEKHHNELQMHGHLAKHKKNDIMHISCDIMRYFVRFRAISCDIVRYCAIFCAMFCAMLCDIFFHFLKMSYDFVQFHMVSYTFL